MRETGTRTSPDRTRPLAVVSAAGLLAVLSAVAYVRTRPASSSRRGAVTGRSAPTQPPAPPDFIEVGPDQYKPASAATDADVEMATIRLLRQAAVSAEEAAASAGTAGEYGALSTADPELIARADALRAEARAMQSYLESRPHRS